MSHEQGTRQSSTTIKSALARMNTSRNTSYHLRCSTPAPSLRGLSWWRLTSLHLERKRWLIKWLWKGERRGN